MKLLFFGVLKGKFCTIEFQQKLETFLRANYLGWVRGHKLPDNQVLILLKIRVL